MDDDQPRNRGKRREKKVIKNLAASMRMCAICNDPRIDEINRAIVTRSIGREKMAGHFRVGRSSIYRHAARHISPELRKDIVAAAYREKQELAVREDEAAVAEWSIDVRHGLHDLGGRIERALQRVEADHDKYSVSDFVKVCDALRKTIAQAALVQGDIARANRAVVLASDPAWLEVRDKLWRWITTEAPDVRARFVQAMKNLPMDDDAITV